MKKFTLLLALMALCLTSGCATYQLSKAWKGGSKVPPPTPTLTPPPKPITP